MEPAREQRLLDHLAILIAGCGVPIFVLSKILGSFYGRYSKGSSHCMAPARLAWALQELPSLVVPLWCARAGGGHLHCWPNWTLLAMFVAHYVQRSVHITHARPAPRRHLQHQPEHLHRPAPPLPPQGHPGSISLPPSRTRNPTSPPLLFLPLQPLTLFPSPTKAVFSLCTPLKTPPLSSLHHPSWIRG